MGDMLHHNATLASNPFVLSDAGNLSMQLSISPHNQEKVLIKVTVPANRHPRSPFLFSLGDSAVWIGPYGLTQDRFISGGTICDREELDLRANATCESVLFSCEAIERLTQAPVDMLHKDA